jgi:acyl-CoA synthetase (AMP-forming)/AMP-acid ligase II
MHAAVMHESVAAIIRARASAAPDAVAISGDGRPLTFGELDARSSRLANALSALGVRRGDRVAYLDHNATEFWETMFAAAKLGAVLTPLNFRLAAPELAAILADAEPAVLVAAAPLLAPLPAGTVPAATRLVTVGADYEDVLMSGGPADPGEQAVGPDLAVLMYSSGTTGASKGVCITAENLLTGVATFTAEFAPDAGSRSLVPPPYYHIAASGWSLIALSAGGRVIQVREPRPEHLLDLMQGHAATHAALVPAIIGLMVELPQARAADFSALRTVVYGAAPIAPGLLRRAVDLFKAEFTKSYGLTETVGVGTLLRPADHRAAIDGRSGPERLRSAGRAAAGVEVAVVDPATGEPLPPGHTGEVVLRGRNVTPGYWRRPEATAALFLPGGWLRTGDAGQLDSGGYLTIADRIKDIIISGGENIIPAGGGAGAGRARGRAGGGGGRRPVAALGGDPAGLRGPQARVPAHGRGADRLLPRAAGPLQVPGQDRVDPGAAKEPVGQGAAPHPARAVLAASRPPGRLTPIATGRAGQ